LLSLACSAAISDAACGSLRIDRIAWRMAGSPTTKRPLAVRRMLSDAARMLIVIEDDFLVKSFDVVAHATPKNCTAATIPSTAASMSVLSL